MIDISDTTLLYGVKEWTKGCSLRIRDIDIVTR